MSSAAVLSSSPLSASSDRSLLIRFRVCDDGVRKSDGRDDEGRGDGKSGEAVTEYARGRGG